jgi:hypothetical protein
MSNYTLVAIFPDLDEAARAKLDLQTAGVESDAMTLKTIDDDQSPDAPLDDDTSVLKWLFNKSGKERATDETPPAQCAALSIRHTEEELPAIYGVLAGYAIADIDEHPCESVATAAILRSPMTAVSS